VSKWGTQKDRQTDRQTDREQDIKIKRNREKRETVTHRQIENDT